MVQSRSLLQRQNLLQIRLKLKMVSPRMQQRLNRRKRMTRSMRSWTMLRRSKVGIKRARARDRKSKTTVQYM
jgi:hypothetical protein